MDKLPPAYWPANIIERIVCYAAFDPTLASKIATNHLHAGKYPCKVANQTIKYQAVCRNWANVVREIARKHLCLEIDGDGEIIANNTKLCAYNRIDSAHYIKRAFVKIEYESIHNNSFIKLWPRELKFNNVMHLDLDISEPNAIADNSTSHNFDSKERAQLVTITLKCMFPNVNTVSIHQYPAPNSSRSILVSAIYDNFVKHILPKAKSDKYNQCMQFNTAHYAVYSQFINTNEIQLCSQLTSIKLNTILSDENNYISLLHCNALTLRKLDLVCHLSLRCVGIIQDADGNPIVYPHVEWLRIAVSSKTAFSNENELLENTVCFPQVRYLHLPGAYPFGNWTLLQDRSRILDTLTLGVNNELVESLPLDSLPKEYLSLKLLKIVSAPATNMNLLPLVAQSSPITMDGLVKVLNYFSGSKLESLEIDFNHTVNNAAAAVAAAANQLTYMYALQHLKLPSIFCSVEDVLDIVNSFPALKTLEYSAGSIPPLSSIDIFQPKPVSNPLSELVVNWDADSLSANRSLSHAAELVATYTAKLSKLLPNVQRIIIQTDDAELRQCQPHLETQHCCKLNVSPESNKTIVKFAAPKPQPDVFALCRPNPV
ncbi:hypothetical protein BX667DRAFT_539054 [Coemansia mojavensis]|nr:hypothetical protein BX667DRAFT_539054 [Coemansia mojavensis]